MIFRQDISIDAKITEAGDPDPNNAKTQTFWYTLVCKNDKIEAQKDFLVAGYLQIMEEDSDDWSLIEAKTQCIFSNQGGIKNDLGRPVLVHQAPTELVPKGSFRFILQPDNASKFIIFMFWYIAWFGFAQLVIKGPGSYLVKFWNGRSK